MNDPIYGRVLSGDVSLLKKSWAMWQSMPVDWDLQGVDPVSASRRQQTLQHAVTLRGPGTFFGRKMRTITLEPCDREGWWIERADLPDALPIHVSIRNVWTTGKIVSNIVLRSGSEHNYLRMAEHIIAMKLGMNIDNLIVRVDSGDPPLFDHGSFDLVEKIKTVGLRETEKHAVYYTVTEPVTVVSPSGSFLTLTPCDGPEPVLHFDCAIDFPTAIGRQRIRFPVNPVRFEYAAWARTNTSFAKMFYCYTVGKLFADIRNLGYTSRNILIASRFGYFNKPRLDHEGKSLEAVWHRSCLDLLAAFALLEGGRFAGNVISYKAGHGLDVETIRLLYQHGLLRVWNGSA